MHNIIAFCCLLEAVSGVISCVAVEQVGRDVSVKYGDFRSNRSRDIRAVQFVMDNERRMNFGILFKCQGQKVEFALVVGKYIGKTFSEHQSF